MMRRPPRSTRTDTLLPYTTLFRSHHGILRHFLPVELGRGEKSSILWTPSCDTITQHAACEMALHHKHGLPDRPSFLAQLFDVGNHFMVPRYIPACWSTLRRWQQAQTTGDRSEERRVGTEGVSTGRARWS